MPGTRPWLPVPRGGRAAGGCAYGAAAVALALGLLASAMQAIPAACAQEDPGGMVRIPGGTFTMGNAAGPEDEHPAHAVTLAAFLLDRRPVTQAEFADFLNASGRLMDGTGRRLYDWDDGDARIHKTGGRFRADRGYESHPVNEASWYGARAYCAWRGKRLPTEAEWERAAKGVDGRTYPWGEAPPDATRARFGKGWIETVPAGSLLGGATPEGLLDMAGNIHEWLSSLYRPYPYDAGDGREDPDAAGERVTRGGAADTGAETLRTTWRGRGVSRGPRSGHHNIGFRCAKSLP